jgi:hypothetical protein
MEETLHSLRIKLPTEIMLKPRSKCSIDGCNRLQRNKGQIGGLPYWGTKCQMHHRANGVYPDEFRTHINQRVNNTQCSICGWNKGPCDRHRIKPEIGYIPENVVILCPNCHRLETLGIADFGH